MNDRRKKGLRPTPTRSAALRAQAAWGTALRGWLNRKREPVPARQSPARHGVTARMAAVPKPRREWVHLHLHPTTRTRKARGLRRLRSLRNEPYVNPARDAKRHARLRAELRP